MPNRRINARACAYSSSLYRSRHRPVVAVSDVTTASSGSSPGGNARASSRGTQSDEVAVGEHVRLTEPVAEHVDRAARGERAGGHHLHKARFADAVGTEQHPFATPRHLEIDIGEDRAPVPAQLHTLQPQCSLRASRVPTCHICHSHPPGVFSQRVFFHGSTCMGLTWRP